VVFPVFFLVGGVYIAEGKKAMALTIVFMSGLTQRNFLTQRLTAIHDEHGSIEMNR
jgi:hypothetical protein